jgi:serine/threonine protein kinase
LCFELKFKYMYFENLIYQIGQKIENYTINSFLGSGAYGEVYQVEWETSNRGKKSAAVKVFNDSVFRNIIKEVSVWASVGKNNNVLSLLHADIIDNRVWLFSEYIENGSLKSWLDRNRVKDFSYRDYFSVITGTLRGLTHLHRNGILHRDLKPANILLKGKSSGSGHIKDYKPLLADFGLARNLDLIQTDARLGTPLYSSPELHTAEYTNRTCTEQDDLWAACVIFQELLTGQKPFLEKEDIINCFYSKLSSDFPVELQFFFQKQFQIDKSKRFQSATEILLEIELIARKFNINI